MVVKGISGEILDSVKPLMAVSLILTFFLGIGIGYYFPVNESRQIGVADTCPAEITSLDALNVTLADPEVIGLLGNKSIDRITFSGGSYGEEGNYTQIVFYPLDPDPDDRMTASMIVVQVNDSCMVSAAYETYPSYIPEVEA
jgi:hypothetical protein